MKRVHCIAHYIIFFVCTSLIICACVPSPSVFEQNIINNEQESDFAITYPTIETRSDATLAPDIPITRDMNKIDMILMEDMFIADPQLTTHSIQWKGSPTTSVNRQSPTILGTFEWSYSSQR